MPRSEWTNDLVGLLRHLDRLPRLEGETSSTATQRLSILSNSIFYLFLFISFPLVLYYILLLIFRFGLHLKFIYRRQYRLGNGTSQNFQAKLEINIRSIFKYSIYMLNKTQHKFHLKRKKK